LKNSSQFANVLQFRRSAWIAPYMQSRVLPKCMALLLVLTKNIVFAKAIQVQRNNWIVQQMINQFQVSTSECSALDIFMV